MQCTQHEYLNMIYTCCIKLSRDNFERGTQHEVYTEVIPKKQLRYMLAWTNIAIYLWVCTLKQIGCSNHEWLPWLQGAYEKAGNAKLK